MMVILVVMPLFPDGCSCTLITKEDENEKYEKNAQGKKDEEDEEENK